MERKLAIPVILFLLAAVVRSDGENDTRPTTGCECNAGYKTLSSTGYIEISSPNYPGDYCPNEDCGWVISAPANMHVAFVIEHMDTEQSQDWIRIYDGQSTGSNQMESCSGTTCSNMTSSGRYMTITFTSDSSIQMSGFLARLTAVQHQCNCPHDKQVSLGYSDSKTITYYPNHYCYNLDCGWTISAPSSSYKVKIDFSSFQTESYQDTLKIYDGSNSYGTLLESCSGSSCNSVTSTSNNMHIEFETDSSITYSGFSATVSSVSCQTSCSNNNKYLYYEGDSTDISSPFDLCSNTDCQWTVRAPTGDVVELSFYTFDLAGQDYVEVFDGSSVYSSSLRTCYGYNSWCNTVTSTNRHITIKFHSHSGTRSRGYSFGATAYAQSGSLGAGAVVGITIGIITLVLIVLVFSILLRIRRRRYYYNNNRVIPTAAPVVPPTVAGYTTAQTPTVYAVPPPTYNQATAANGSQTQPEPPKIC